MINEKRLVDTFLRLAAINAPSRHEKPVADLLVAELETLGFQVARDDAGIRIGGNTGNIIASKKGTLAGATPIALNAHMDTVTPTDGWSYKVEDGVIRSGGNTILGADDRAGIAAILEAIKVLGEQKIPHGDLQIIFTISEETGLFGAKHLDFSLITSKCVYVYDMGKPVGCCTVSAPSQDNLVAKIHGRAAHAGACPENGINAIVTASRAIAGMKLGRIDSETTANIGVISGGEARNIVPGFCEVRGETRSRNDNKLDAQVQHMVELFHEAAAEMGASVEIEIKRLYSVYRLTEQDEIVRIAQAAARSIGIEPELHETGGGSDANIFNAEGIPSSPIGIGMENAHTNDEYMEIADLVKSAEMAVALVQAAGEAGSI